MGEIESANFGFWFSSEIHYELETKTFKFPTFIELTNCDAMSFISENRPFYSCLLSDLAFEWQRGRR